MKKEKKNTTFAVHFLTFPIASNHLLYNDFEKELSSFCVEAGNHISQE